MGIFSGEDVYSGTTLVNPLYSEESIAEISNTDVDLIEPILNNSNISSYILRSAFNRRNAYNKFASKMEEFFNYGQTTFTNGLPQSASYTTSVDPTVLANIQSAIETEEGEDITILQVLSGQPKTSQMVDAYARKTLVDTYPNWDGLPISVIPYTIKSTVSGFETIDIPDPVYAGNSWKKGTQRYPNLNIFIISSSAPNDNHVATVPFSATYRPFYNVTSSEYYLHYGVIYSIDSSGDSGVWLYNTNDGTYPLLTDSTGSVTTTRFYPIIPFRVDYESFDNTLQANTLHDQYDVSNTAEDALDILGIDIDDLIASIEDNPEIASVNDAFIAVKGNMYSNNNAMKHYFYAFWEAISQDNAYNEFTEEVLYDQYNAKKDYLIEDFEYNVTISFFRAKQIAYTKAALLSEYGVDTDTLGLSTATANDSVLANTIAIVSRPSLEDDYNLPVKKLGKSGNTYVPTGETLPIASTALLIKQTDTNIFSVIEVVGLEYYSLFPNDGNLTVRIFFDNDEDAFYLPINYDILNDMGLGDFDQSLIVQESLVIFINAITVQHLSWYETGAFADLLEVVLIVVAIITAIPSGGSSFGAVDALLAVIKYFVITELIDLLLEPLLDLLGIDGVLKAFIVAAAKAYFTGNLKLANATALDYLNASTQLLLPVNAVKLEEEYEDLADEQGEWTTEYEERIEALDDKAEELGLVYTGDEFIDPNSRTSAVYDLTIGVSRNTYIFNSFNLNEDPDGFYNRTVGQTNPGVLSLEYPDYYVDTLLELPKPTLSTASLSPDNTSN